MSESTAARDYDVIVWGATGFTGRLVAEYMYNTYGLEGEVRWAVAGRNAAKLADICRDITGGSTGGSSSDKAADVPTVVADSHDEVSLREMVRSTAVICTTVGPYAMYGSELVRLCAEEGTHYCDLTGEVHWMRRMIEQYHSVAEASGARIVHSCGFDSIPSDLGTWFVQDAMNTQHGVFATRVKYRVVRAEGGASGGTVASMMNMMEEARDDPSILEVLDDPYALNPPNMPRGDDVADQTTAEYDLDFHQWTAPFVMAAINTRVVRRSHSLLGYPWGTHFRYDEATLTGDGPRGFARASMVAGGTGLLTAATRVGPLRNLLGKIAPSPGEGPSAETIRNGFFEIDLHASHPEDPEKNLTARVTGDRDPGYGATSKMLAESAVCLALDGLDTPAGVVTPAVAMGGQLVKRLIARAGMTFTV